MGCKKQTGSHFTFKDDHKILRFKVFFFFCLSHRHWFIHYCACLAMITLYCKENFCRSHSCQNRVTVSLCENLSVFEDEKCIRVFFFSGQRVRRKEMCESSDLLFLAVSLPANFCCFFFSWHSWCLWCSKSEQLHCVCLLHTHTHTNTCCNAPLLCAL